ncbi:MAG TPA: hypothetical protein VGR28_02215 [Candidatus Thermoplasmatota archaeon]|jgi:hypothetical protein|nr:hypothetical protein [Candidatus Thermoplasmatota archaeon]
MRRASLLLALALLALPAPAPAAPTAQGTVIPWSLLDCFFAYGQVIVPGSQVQPYMPEGFRPAMIGVPGLPPVLTSVGIEIDVCRAGEGLNGLVSPMIYTNLWVGAIAPEDLAGEPGAYFVAWDFLTPDADRRALFQDAGLPARDGSIAVQETQLADMRTAFAATWTLEGLGGFGMTAVGAPANTEAIGGGHVVSFTPRADGQLSAWRFDWDPTDAHQGAGVVTVPEGSWLAAMLGGTTHVGRVVFGAWSYTNGSIDLLVERSP